MEEINQSKPTMKDCARMEECGMTTSKQIDSWKSILTMAIDTMEEEKYQL